MWSPPSFLQKSQPLTYRCLYTPITCHLLTRISVKKVHMFLADIYLFKFNHENTRTMYEIRSKLTKKIPEWRQCYSCVFIITFEQISHIFDVFISQLRTSKYRQGWWLFCFCAWTSAFTYESFGFSFHIEVSI